MAEPDTATDRAEIGPFETKLAEVDPNLDPIEREHRVLESTAFFDFSFYEFLFPTEVGYQGSLSERALATVDDFQAEVGAELAALLLDVLGHVERTIRARIKRLRRRDWDEERVVDDLIDDLYRLRADVFPDVVEDYQSELQAGIGGLFLQFLAELLDSYLTDRLFQAYPAFYAFWSGWPPFYTTEYPAWHLAVQPPPPPPPPTEPPDDSQGVNVGQTLADIENIHT
jgi:hypothetical protein